MVGFKIFGTHNSVPAHRPRGVMSLEQHLWAIQLARDSEKIRTASKLLRKPRV